MPSRCHEAWRPCSLKLTRPKSRGEGYSIVVVDSIGGKTTATKVVAKFDKDLAKRLPITKGFYWERCPPVVIPGGETEIPTGSGYDIATLDAKEQWRDATRPTRPPFIEAAHLKRVPDIGNFAFCINLTESPVMGGIHLHALQQQVADIPLWRDQIPELSIKVMKDGRQQRFHLVSRGTTVKPTRGKPVTIPVEEAFTLPDGRLYYSFPLYIGGDTNDLGFSARLDSPAFPLKNMAECELKLTFEYGADDPYMLVFTPLDKHLPAYPALLGGARKKSSSPMPLRRNTHIRCLGKIYDLSQNLVAMKPPTCWTGCRTRLRSLTEIFISTPNREQLA
jgi:hypothetical protein